jgi:hypothetical protein
MGVARTSSREQVVQPRHAYEAAGAVYLCRYARTPPVSAVSGPIAGFRDMLCGCLAVLPNPLRAWDDRNYPKAWTANRPVDESSRYFGPSSLT